MKKIAIAIVALIGVVSVSACNATTKDTANSGPSASVAAAPAKSFGPTAGSASTDAYNALSGDSQMIVNAVVTGNDMGNLCRNADGLRSTAKAETISLARDRKLSGSPQEAGEATAAYWPVYCRDLATN